MVLSALKKSRRAAFKISHKVAWMVKILSVAKIKYKFHIFLKADFSPFYGIRSSRPDEIYFFCVQKQRWPFERHVTITFAMLFLANFLRSMSKTHGLQLCSWGNKFRIFISVFIVADTEPSFESSRLCASNFTLLTKNKFLALQLVFASNVISILKSKKVTADCKAVH